jgi:PAS domain S-box-containing protein
MGITTGLLAALIVLLGVSLWHLFRQRHEYVLKSKVLAATGCSVVVTDATVPRYPILYVNPAFRLLTGYADDDVIGQSLSFLQGPQTDRAITEKLALTIQEGRTCRLCLRHYRKNGTPFWNEVTLSPVKNRAGSVTKYIWVMSDVSHRRQTEEVVQELRQDPPTLLPDLASEGMLVHSETEILYINQAGVKILGATDAAQVIGHQYLDFLPQYSQEPVRRQPTEFGAPCEPATKRDERLLRRDGRWIAVELSTAPIRWQAQASLLVCFSERQLKTQTQAMAHLGSWEWELGTDRETWSDELMRIFGYEPGSLRPTSDTFRNALHSEDRDRALAAIDRTLNSGNPYDFDCRIVRPNGEIRFVRCRGSVTLHPTDSSVRLSGTVHDVTDYRLVEEAAKEREAQFQLVVESSPTGILIARQDGTISLANERVAQLFGYTRGELLGRSVECLLPLHNRLQFRQHCEDYFSAPTACAVGVEQDLRGLRKDGTEFPVEIELNPLRLASGISVLATVIDLTTRHQAEQAIREKEERLNLAVQAGQVGIFEHHHKTDCLYWSPMLRTIYGVQADEPGSLQRYIELIHHADRDRILSAIRQAHDGAGEGEFHVEHRIVRPDGGIRQISLRSITWFEGEGATRMPVRTIGTVVDITDWKQAEMQLRNSSKMEAIGTLAGGLAHEFNNSLTAVLGFGELALRLVPTDSKAQRHIQQVITAGRKSRELVHQLLTFSRQSEQVRRPLSLHSLVKESLKLLRPTIPSWIELREQIARSTRPISADMTQMHQMILNLVENAVDAMRTTGGVLEFQLHDEEFSTDQVTRSGPIPAGCYSCLTVRDSGEGMEPEVADRIFDPFFTTKQPGEGRGMGLSVVHGIVTSHGGLVSVESQLGLGTTVSVYLPALPARASSTPAKSEPLPRGHECILFVDDEESLAQFGGEMLESLGYYSVVRMSAAEAWQAFKVAPQRFDLLITDQTMPGMSGDVLARQCRKLRPDLPVILCTGSDGTLSAEEAQAQGISEFVMKPLLVQDLAQTIRRVLDCPPPTATVSTVPPRQHTDHSLVLIEETDAVGSRR